MDHPFKEQILHEAISNPQRLLLPVPKGFREVVSPTEYTCDCGGRFGRVHLVVDLRPPRHRKRRIQKKWLKKWRQKHQAMVLVSALLLTHSSYRCSACGTRQGGYSFLGRQIFKVESLPQGATPVYDRDPEVGVLVTIFSNGSTKP